MKPNKLNAKKSNHTTPNDTEFEADVLFQRICKKWYAFSVVEDDCFVTEVPNERINRKFKKVIQEQ
mgnify:CR=1 FL=1